jgi:hypothetical protein
MCSMQDKISYYISHHISVRLIWVPMHSGVSGNESADLLARAGSAHRLLDHSRLCGCWGRTLGTGSRVGYLTSTWLWQGLNSTQRQARELILGPSLTAKTRLLSFNSMQPRLVTWVTSLVTEHNTLWWHLYIMGLVDSPLCRRCWEEEETSAHVLCECEALATLRHHCLGSLVLDAEDVTSLRMGAVRNLLRGQDSHGSDSGVRGTKGLLKA